MFIRARLLGLLLLLMGCLGLVAACGDNPTPTPPPPTATPVPPTPAVALTTGPGGAPAGAPGSAADVALVNDAITQTVGTSSYHFIVDLTIPGRVAATHIEGDYKAPDKAHLTIKSPNQTAELINIGTTGYLRRPDGTWASTDLAAAAGSAGADTGLGSLGAMAGGLDPSKATNIFGALARFASGVNTANVVGPDTIASVPVTHYNVPIFLGNLMGTGGSTTPGEQPLGYGDVWIDPATKLVHRLNVKVDLTDLMRSFSALGPTVDLKLPSPTPMPPLAVEMRVDLSSFGTGPDITAPAGATKAP